MSRLIDKGVVIEKNGRYAYRCDLEIARIRKLEAQIKEKSDSNPEIAKLKGELDEARANIEYYRESYDELLEDRRNRLEKGFKWCKANPNKVKFVKFEEWYKWVMSEDDYI